VGPAAGITSHLITIASTAPGAGKSTLMAALADRLRADGSRVLELSEDAVWGERAVGSDPVDYTTAWPVFYDLLHRDQRVFRVSPAEVLEVFLKLRDQVIAERSVWLQDWPWPDLPDKLGWDAAASLALSDDLLAASKLLRPRLLYLRVDATAALQQAARSRGTAWLNRHAGLAVDAPADGAAVATVARRWVTGEATRLEGLRPWQPVGLDASQPAARVLDDAWHVLQGEPSDQG